MRSTLIDIAKESGVSTATVDRVLNNRPGVMERTRTIVMEAAKRVGYYGDSEIAEDKIRLHFGVNSVALAGALNAHDRLTRGHTERVRAVARSMVQIVEARDVKAVQREQCVGGRFQRGLLQPHEELKKN